MTDEERSEQNFSWPPRKTLQPNENLISNLLEETEE